MEKVRNFLRNYLESEKFFSKFSYFLGEGKIFQPKSETKSGKSKNFLERENFGIFLESENFQNLKK
jgi:hypothetical protein